MLRQIYLKKKKNFILIMILIIDLDVDSQGDGTNIIMSGPDSDSESDVGDGPELDEFCETSYFPCAEDEFGAVIIILLL